MKKTATFFSLWLIIFSCGAPEVPKGFDFSTWRRDAMGCSNLRQKQLEGFINIVKPYLLEHAFGEMQVRKLLGKADAIEIAERGMKFYYYYIEKGKQCQKQMAKKGRYVQIRFDALHRVSEVAIVTP